MSWEYGKCICLISLLTNYQIICFFHSDLRERYKNFLLFYYMYENNCFSDPNYGFNISGHLVIAKVKFSMLNCYINSCPCLYIKT